MRLRNLIKHSHLKNHQSPNLLGAYQYQPLPSPTCIRLLQLSLNGNGAEIHCSLHTFELRNAPAFRAISYTWGDSNVKLPLGQKKARRPLKRVSSIRETSRPGKLQRHSISCDGSLLKVTSNLRDALRMLATSTNLHHAFKAPSYYWIDALCMDQSNTLEKNDQVARMAEIYVKADSVVIWLGKEDKYTNDALVTMRTISALAESEWPLVPYTSFYDPERTQRTQRPNLTLHNWLGFMVLINRPWFNRAWVVQEIALARSALVVCGSKMFNWGLLSATLAFIKATKWYHHLHTEKMRHVKELQERPGIYKKVLHAKLSIGIGPIYVNETRMSVIAPPKDSKTGLAQPPPLRMLLDKHRFSSSSDPRDKVYAFVGLASRSMSPFRTQPNVLVPNYDSRVQDVYTEAACVLMTSYKNISLLSHVEDASARRILDLPSWVPDLSVPLDPYPLRFRGPKSQMVDDNRRWKPNVDRMKQGLLDVQGCRFDYIDETSVLLDESSDPSASWASIVKLVLSLDDQYPDPVKSGKEVSRVEVLWRTLTTDVYAHIHPAPPEVGLLFIEYILNLQVRHRLTPWSGKDVFQPHHTPLSDSVYPEWRTLLSLEPLDSPYCLSRYTERLTSIVGSMFDGTYSPIGLAQLQHEMDQSGGKKRRLFRTRGEYLGTGPRSLQKGDEVWILHRGGVPFVLRPQPNGNYRLVGEAFVYGIMHGEALHGDPPRCEITIE